MFGISGSAGVNSDGGIVVEISGISGELLVPCEDTYGISLSILIGSLISCVLFLNELSGNSQLVVNARISRMVIPK